ncbi:hypothetical protein DM860_010547 [Cuscuta australis]|uniref:Uncharacterized protein n=1 Tax=Cuscuta australis TaxID=267555 RepID=A0A328E5F2_9ASTE|nr:hypothetical protein DM860_010547 [Cuscuta australis]
MARQIGMEELDYQSAYELRGSRFRRFHGNYVYRFVAVLLIPSHQIDEEEEEDDGGGGGGWRRTTNSRRRLLVGTQLFSHSDPAKASKSKSKKIAVEYNEPCTSTTDQIFHPTDTLGNDFSAEIGSHCQDFENLSLLNTNEEELEAECIDFVPHIYIPGLLSGLDDCSTFPEFTGIG